MVCLCILPHLMLQDTEVLCSFSITRFLSYCLFSFHPKRFPSIWCLSKPVQKCLSTLNHRLLHYPNLPVLVYTDGITLFAHVFYAVTFLRSNPSLSVTAVQRNCWQQPTCGYRLDDDWGTWKCGLKLPTVTLYVTQKVIIDFHEYAKLTHVLGVFVWT